MSEYTNLRTQADELRENLDLFIEKSVSWEDIYEASVKLDEILVKIMRMEEK